MHKSVIPLELKSDKVNSPRDLPNRRTQTGGVTLEWRRGHGKGHGLRMAE